MARIEKDLGAVTAYAYAVEHGYTGTEEEFAEEIGNAANYARQAAESAGAAAQSAESASGSAGAASGSADNAAGSARDAAASARDAQSAVGTATSAASDANLAAGRAEAKAQLAAGSADEAAGRAGEASGYATAASGAKDDAVAAKNAAETAQGKAEDAQRAAEAAAASIDPDTLVKKADLPETTVGYANQARLAIEAKQIATDRLIDNAEEACPPVVFGAQGGAAEVQDGYSHFAKLLGNSVAWNQLLNPADFAASDVDFVDGVKITNNADGSVTITVAEGGATASRFYNLFSTRWTFPDHTIYGGQTPENIALANTYSAGSTVFSNTIYKNTYTAAQAFRPAIWVKAGCAEGTDTIYPQLFDLTRIYGTGNEPTTVAEFTAVYPNRYYAFNNGAIIDSKPAKVTLIGRNQWDEQWEEGIYDRTNGEKTTGSRVRSKNLTRVIPNTEYFFVAPSGKSIFVLWYDINGNFISAPSGFTSGTVTSPNNAHYMAFYMESAYGTTYNHDICIYINYDTPNLPYAAYHAQEITLPDITLRSAGSVRDVALQEGGGTRYVGVETLTADHSIGDTITISAMKSNTTAVTSKYVELSNWATISGTTLTLTAPLSNGDKINYELATPTEITTTENAGWQELVEADNFGTILFEQGGTPSVIVPQAYFIEYKVNLVEFLDTLYVNAGGDAGNVALKSDIKMTPAPTTDGVYIFKATVSGGTATYSWEAAE